MALKIRLARAGAKKRPYYRIVIAENTSPRDGRFIERVGSYNPMLPREHQDRIRLVEDRIKHWLGMGAQPTDRVARFLGEAKIIAMPVINESPKKSLPKQKAQERIKEKAEKREAAKTAPVEAVAQEEPIESPTHSEPVPQEEPKLEAANESEAVQGEESQAEAAVVPSELNEPTEPAETELETEAQVS
jgi:small subunit ribosomal protein S16